MSKFEKFKTEEVPPVSEETLKKIEQKAEVPKISQETLEKIKQKPEIPPLPEDLRKPRPEWLDKTPESPKLPELPELPEIELETPPQQPTIKKPSSFGKKFVRGAKYTGIAGGGFLGGILTGIWFLFKEAKEIAKDLWKQIAK